MNTTMSSRTRAHRGRSRRGCATCRIRKIRCDEHFHTNATTNPSCRNCIRTGRECEGPTLLDFIVQSFSPARAKSHTIEPYLEKPFHRPLTPPEEGELRVFEFYIRHGASSIAQTMDGEFWTRLLPQLSQHDISIKHALLAISSLHECPQDNDSNIEASPAQTRAVSWYRQSVKGAMLQTTLESDTRRLEYSILTCLLFAIIETQYSNASNATQLLVLGLKLIAQYRERQSHNTRPSSPWMEHVLPMYGRQVMHLGIFRGEISPEYSALLQSLLPDFWSPLRSLEHARDCLYAIAHQIIPLAITISSSGAALGLCSAEILTLQRQTQMQVLTYLGSWEQPMRQLPIPDSMSHMALYHSLFCFHKMTTMWIFWIFNPPQDLARQDTTTVVGLLDSAEAALQHMPTQPANSGSAPVTMEMGVIPFICFVLWQCRQHDQITERATSLLRHASRLENMYVARLQTDVVARLLGFEANLARGSGAETFVEEVLMHSYSWEQVASDAIRGVRRTRKWTWEVDEQVTPSFNEWTAVA